MRRMGSEMGCYCDCCGAFIRESEIGALRARLDEVERGARVPEDWEAAFAKLREFCPECRCERGHKMDCSRWRRP